VDQPQRSSTSLRPSDIRMPATQEEAAAAIELVEGKVAAVREQLADVPDDEGDAARRPIRAALGRWTEKLAELRYAKARIDADAVLHPEERAALLERMRLMPRNAPEEQVGLRIASLTRRLHDARAFSMCVVNELVACGARATPLAEQMLRSFGREVSADDLAAWEREFRARLTRAAIERAEAEDPS